MTEPQRPLARQSQGQYEMASDRRQPADLADILERVLDKGIVIAGDIKVNLLEVELITIKIRLLIASVDKAKEMGIDWWENDPLLSTRRRGSSRWRVIAVSPLIWPTSSSVSWTRAS